MFTERDTRFLANNDQTFALYIERRHGIDFANHQEKSPIKVKSIMYDRYCKYINEHDGINEQNRRNDIISFIKKTMIDMGLPVYKYHDLYNVLMRSLTDRDVVIPPLVSNIDFSSISEIVGEIMVVKDKTIDIQLPEEHNQPFTVDKTFFKIIDDESDKMVLEVKKDASEGKNIYYANDDKREIAKFCYDNRVINFFGESEFLIVNGYPIDLRRLYATRFTDMRVRSNEFFYFENVINKLGFVDLVNLSMTCKSVYCGIKKNFDSGIGEKVYDIFFLWFWMKSREEALDDEDSQDTYSAIEEKETEVHKLLVAKKYMKYKWLQDPMESMDEDNNCIQHRELLCTTCESGTLYGTNTHLMNGLCGFKTKQGDISMAIFMLIELIGRENLKKVFFPISLLNTQEITLYVLYMYSKRKKLIIPVLVDHVVKKYRRGLYYHRLSLRSILGMRRQKYAIYSWDDIVLKLKSFLRRGRPRRYDEYTKRYSLTRIYGNKEYRYDFRKEMIEIKCSNIQNGVQMLEYGLPPPKWSPCVVPVWIINGPEVEYNKVETDD